MAVYQKKSEIQEWKVNKKAFENFIPKGHIGLPSSVFRLPSQ
ncbi:hypothetical protein [Cognataquiflexum rubidum]|nr:hypothetical protein [Cognataquiflexum rubidum]